MHIFEKKGIIINNTREDHNGKIINRRIIGKESDFSSQKIIEETKKRELQNAAAYKLGLRKSLFTKRASNAIPRKNIPDEKTMASSRKMNAD